MTITNKYLLQFEAYFNGDLGAVEKKAFEGSLDHNSEMRFAWTEYRSMMDAFSDKEAISLRLKLNDAFYNQHHGLHIKRFVNGFWFRLSAAAVIIIVMGGLLYFFCSNGPVMPFFKESGLSMVSDSANTSTNDISADSTINIPRQLPEENHKSVPDPVQIASIFDKEEYKISPAFAELLHNVYRSNWFGLITPVDSVMFTSGDSLKFSWETNIQEPIYFDVLDRNGRVVYQHPKPITNPWSFSPDLSPAIYMFRFATKEQPVWMGVMIGI